MEELEDILDNFYQILKEILKYPLLKNSLEETVVGKTEYDFGYSL